ncbi:hypothetical protein [Vibrio splendidus]|uniref:hypothetical protein n=2 Tax=Vibrio splendidus TaxID=29497 RepID=UPI00037AA780|nr:hypothetical protein [Vibrio splendidus]MCC4879365.1 hypothetical protein [Vibrio splendidus]
MNTQSIASSHLAALTTRDEVMPEYLCENCTIAYCFDDCCSPLAQKDMIEVEELVRRFDVEHDDEKSEKSEQDIEDSNSPNHSGIKNPHK